MRRTTKITVVVYLIRGNVSRQIIWHLVAMRLRCAICWMEGASLDFLLFICPQTEVQTDNLVLMWSAAFCSWSSTFFLLWCILFEVERGILLDELLFLFACLVDPCIPFALMWWVAFSLQDRLHPFCYSVVMTPLSFLLLINWPVLRGSGHDA